MRRLSILLVILLAVSTFSISFQPNKPTVADTIYEPPQDESFNWTTFWTNFKQHAVWDLEYNSGSGWISCKEALDVIIDAPTEDSRKVTLDFTAPYTADYRLTLGIDYKVQDYINRTDEYIWELVYANFTLVYDFSDIAEIPGIIITHGFNGEYFWFRARRDNVNEGTRVILDPHYQISTINAFLFLENQRKLVRQSNGTLWATYHYIPGQRYPRLAYSTDEGVTWTNINFTGYLTYGEYTSICVDSNDVVHMMFYGKVVGKTATLKLIYTNTTDLTNFQIIPTIGNPTQYSTGLAADSNDVVHLTWANKSAPYQIMYANSNTWLDNTTHIQISDEATAGDNQDYASIAINSTNCIHVAWKGTDYSNDKDQILYSHSDDGGSTWSGETDISQGTLGDAHYPVIAIDDRDYVHIVWRNTTGNIILHTYNDSIGWQNRTILDVGVTYATVSYDNRDFIYVFYEKDGKLYYRYNNTLVWSARTIADTWFTNADNPNTICAQWPRFCGIRSNRPDTGWALIVENNTIYYANSTDLTWEDLGGSPPIISNSNPANHSTVPYTVTIINATITDTCFSFDWTIETYPDVGSNSSAGDSNGSKQCTVALECGGTYIWWVNATNSQNKSSIAVYYLNTTTCPHYVYVTTTVPNGTWLCPCSDAINVTIADSHGEAMNISFLHSCNNISFHEFGVFTNKDNGTYGVCIDAGPDFKPCYFFSHSNTSQTVAVAGTWYDVWFDEAPSLSNRNSYNDWDDTDNESIYVNVSGYYEISYWLSFDDTEQAPNSDVYGRVTCNGNEIHGSLAMKHLSVKNGVGVVSKDILCYLEEGDEVKVQYTSTDTTSRLITVGAYGDHPDCSVVTIYKIFADRAHTIGFGETWYWKVNVSEVANASCYELSSVYWFRTKNDTSECESGGGGSCTDTDTISDERWIVGIAVLFGVAGPLIWSRRRRRR